MKISEIEKDKNVKTHCIATSYIGLLHPLLVHTYKIALVQSNVHIDRS